MLTVPDAARRVGRDPETVRRWIRSGRLRARKVGTQHVIDERDLEILVGSGQLPVPKRWQTFESGRQQPDWVALIRESRRGR
jgi:excisionase family DNA binding protein